MPRTRPLPEPESKICSRLKEWRVVLGITQQTIGDLMGVHQSYVAQVEGCRAPLRYWHAYLLVNTGFLNVHWLATGAGNMLLQTPIPSSSELGRGGRVLLSAIYESHFAHGPIPPTEILPRHQLRPYLDALSQEWTPKIPLHRVSEFVDTIEKAAGIFFAIHQPDPPALVEPRKRLCVAFGAVALAVQAKLQKSVDVSDVKQYLTHVRGSYWESLRERLIGATRHPGKSSDLARTLKLSRSAVSQWLTGKTSPSAELTLRLLHWVASEEAKQETLAGAANTGKGKNQTRKKSDHDNSASRRKA